MYDDVSFRHMSRNGIVESYGRLIFVFWEFSTLISIIAVPVYNPTNSEYYPFSTSLPAFIVGCSIDLCHSNWGKIKSYFDLHFYSC